MKIGPLVLTAALAACGAPSEGPTSSAVFPLDSFASISSDTGALHLELRTAPAQPPTRGEAQMEVRITDSKAQPVDNLDLHVLPWMPSHAHGTSVIPLVTFVGNGVYRIERLELYMPGEWQLRMTVDALGRQDHATASLEIP